MINALISDDYKNITKISILDAKKVFYPLSYVLQKRTIVFDDDAAIQIIPMLEDVKYPGTVKLSDAGTLREYRIDVSVNAQSPEVTAQLERFINKKVIVVLHHNYGKIIFGCNEHPLSFIFNDDNTTNPSGDNGFSIQCRGNSYFLKVLV
jgi:hypothetical protein